MRRAVLLALIVAALTAPAAASAACPRGARCARLTVPLDHRGATPGTLSLAYAKLPATGTATGTIVLLSGGPGQAALPLTAGFARLVAPLRASYDVVTVDQRGTGGSGAVACVVDDCAARLGEARAFLNTPETARDLEDLRAALGAEKLTLVGISYGAKVAGEYARRYPGRTAALVLDSPAPVDGLDAVGQLRVLGAPRVMREVCFPGLCHRTVPAPADALEAAVERLRGGALRGPLALRSGRVITRRVTERDLYDVLALSDLVPALRAGLPAAIASLAARDAAPLLHLLGVAGRAAEGDLDAGRLLATTCIEGRLPWAPESPVASRAGALEAFIRARSRSFAPFSARTVVESSAAALCADWPPTPRPDAVAYRGPDVPVLVISGRDDLRTPLEDARRTALQYPNAKVLAVPGVGHSVLSSDPTGCARAALIDFLRARAVRNCTRRFGVVAAPYAPARLDRLRPTHLPGLRGRTLSAITVTLTGLAFDAATQTRSFRLPGLRGGYVRGTRSALELHDVEWIRDVRVTGRLDRRGRGTLAVGGAAAAPGTVTYTGGGASGVLGGVPFRL